MAEIKFYANILNGGSTEIAHALGSGLGFYGSDFGISVPVGSQQTTTFTTNANGTATNGVRLNNTAMATSGHINEIGTVSVNSTEPMPLWKLSNHLCPLNIRFTHDTPVKVQNCKLRIFDRKNIANHASGVTTWVYEARKPSATQSVNSLRHRAYTDGSSSGFRWTEFDPTFPQFDMNFTASPGISGQNTDNLDAVDPDLNYTSRSGISLLSMRHDWYVALSSQPDGIGSKTDYGLYFTVEYL